MLFSLPPPGHNFQRSIQDPKLSGATVATTSRASAKMLINDCKKLKHIYITFDDITFIQRFKKIDQLVQKLKRGTHGRVIS
jgi:hypothetical protein